MLEVRDLDVKYGAATAVRRVSLDVAAGELVCVVGPNGAGKSTLINAIAGLHPASSGTMSFDGCDLTRLAPHRFCAAGIAIVPEGRRLFTGMGPPRAIPDDVQRKCTADSLQFNPKFGAGQDVFNALTRAIDRIDSSYKQ